MNEDAPGQRIHARLVRLSDTADETVREGSLSAMAEALFGVDKDDRELYVVETIEGRFAERDLIAKLQSGELEG